MTSDRNEALRLMRGIENGNLATADAYEIARQRDPILLYFVLRYLREKHQPGNPASAGAAARLLELTSTYPDVIQRSKAGERDAMREWFDDTHSMREFFGKDEAFIDLIIDKLES